MGLFPALYLEKIVELNNNYMWLHIRGVGEWTNRLYNYFEREQDKLHNIQEDIHGLPTAVNQSLLNGSSDSRSKL
ncbi:unnamed protein product [Timema podura]|uniref:Uncharacterized protein n=1 Tax=Timema podura TaxID=61482 RepID=A0ABN7NUW4_TIMPD|nr:unnamed protein product [Timema podura]